MLVPRCEGKGENISKHILIFQKLKGNKTSAAFELVDMLTSSAQNAVHMLCESISMRTGPGAEKVRKVAINPNV